MNSEVAFQRNRHLRRLTNLDPVKPVGKHSKKAPKDKQDYDFLDCLLETDTEDQNKVSQPRTSDTSCLILENMQNYKAEESKRQEEDVSLPIALSFQTIEKSLLEAFLKDKLVCSFNSLRNYLEKQETADSHWKDDFVVFGCIWEKISVREGKLGFKFAVCKLCDMRGRCANLLTMILTRQACDAFWKEHPGTVLMIVSPRVLKPRSHGDGCAIQVDKARKIWILGKAEHYGFCSAMRKDGTICGICIDTRFGNRCAYHENLNIRSKTSTKRPELNSVPLTSAVHPTKHMKTARCQNLSKGAFQVSFGAKKTSLLLNTLECPTNVNRGRTENNLVFQSSVFHNGRHSHGMRYLNNLKNKTSIQDNCVLPVDSVSGGPTQQVEHSIELTDDEE